MVYFYLSPTEEMLVDDKLLGINALVVARQEFTGKIEKENLTSVPTEVEYFKVVDLKDVLMPNEAYYFPEEERYLIRIETGEGNYPRFTLVDSDSITPETEILKREDMADRIMKAPTDKEIVKILRELQVEVPGLWYELSKGFTLIAIAIGLFFGGKYFFETQMKDLQQKTENLTFQTKQLNQLFEKYKYQLYVLKDNIGNKGVKFMSKLEKLPVDELSSLTFTGREWFAVAQVPYWKIEKVKAKCKELGLNCQFSYKRKGIYEVRIR